MNAFVLFSAPSALFVSIACPHWKGYSKDGLAEEALSRP
jgi:hypothetical protein